MAVSTNLGSIHVLISANVAKALANIRAFQGALEGVVTSAQKSVNNIAQSLNSLPLLAASAFGGFALKVGADFETAITNVNSLLNLTEAEFEAMAASLSASAIQLGVDSRIAADGLYQIVSAGVAGSQAIGVLEASIKAGIAGLTSTATAADTITTVLNSFSFAATDAATVAGKLFQVVKDGKTTFEEIASTIGQVAPLAAAAGVSFDEMAAVVATLTKNGVRTAQSMTALRGIIAALIKPTGDAEAKLQSILGGSVEQALQQHGLVGVLDQILAFARGQGDVVTALGEIFTEIEGLAGLSVFAKDNLQGLREELLLVSQAGAGTLEEVFAIQNRTIGRQFALLTNTVFNSFKQAVFEVRERIVGVLAAIREWIGANQEAFQSMIRFTLLVTGLATGLVTLGSVLRVVGFALGGLAVSTRLINVAALPLVSTLTVMRSTMNAVAAATTFLSTRFVAVVAAAQSATLAVRTFIASAITAAAASMRAFTASVVATTTAIAAPFVSAVAAATTQLAAFAVVAGRTAVAALQFFARAITLTVVLLTEMAVAATVGTTRALQQLVIVTGDLVVQSMNAMLAGLRASIAALQAFAVALAGAVAAALRSVTALFATAASGLLTFGVSLLSMVGTLATTVFSLGALQAALSLVVAPLSLMVGLLATVTVGFVGIVGVVAAAGGVFKVLKDRTESVNSVMDGVHLILNRIRESVSGLVARFQEWAEAFGFFEKAEIIFDNIRNAIGAMLVAVTNTVVQFGQWLGLIDQTATGLSSINDLGTLIRTMFEGLVDFLVTFDLGAMFTRMSFIAQIAWQRFKVLFLNVVGIMALAIQDVANTIGQAINGAVNFAARTILRLQLAWRELAEVAGFVWNGIASLVAGVIVGIQDRFNQVVRSAGSMVNSIIRAVNRVTRLDIGEISLPDELDEEAKAKLKREITDALAPDMQRLREETNRAQEVYENFVGETFESFTFGDRVFNRALDAQAELNQLRRDQRAFEQADDERKRQLLAEINEQIRQGTEGRALAEQLANAQERAEDSVLQSVTAAKAVLAEQLRIKQQMAEATAEQAQTEAQVLAQVREQVRIFREQVGIRARQTTDKLGIPRVTIDPEAVNEEAAKFFQRLFGEIEGPEAKAKIDEFLSKITSVDSLRGLEDVLDDQLRTLGRTSVTEERLVRAKNLQLQLQKAFTQRLEELEQAEAESTRQRIQMQRAIREQEREVRRAVATAARELGISRNAVSELAAAAEALGLSGVQMETLLEHAQELGSNGDEFVRAIRAAGALGLGADELTKLLGGAQSMADVAAGLESTLSEGMAEAAQSAAEDLELTQQQFERLANAVQRAEAAGREISVEGVAREFEITTEEAGVLVGTLIRLATAARSIGFGFESIQREFTEAKAKADETVASEGVPTTPGGVPTTGPADLVNRARTDQVLAGQVLANATTGLEDAVEALANSLKSMMLDVLGTLDRVATRINSLNGEVRGHSIRLATIERKLSRGDSIGLAGV